MKENLKTFITVVCLLGVLLQSHMNYETRKELEEVRKDFNELKQSNSDFKNEVAVDVWKNK